MAEKDLSREMESLKADLTKLREDFAGVTEALKEAGQKKTEDARQGLVDLMTSLMDELRGALGKAKDTGSKSVEAVGHQIELRPLTSLFTAFGVGFVIAKLLHRR